MRNRFILALGLPFLLAIGIETAWAVGPAPTPDENPEGNTGALKSQVQTGGSYDAHSGNATRMVNDLHVPGALGAYGLDFTRYWNSVRNDDDNANADWPMDFAASGWSHSWKWTAQESHDEIFPEGVQGPAIYNTAITITFPDGHASKFKITRTNRPVGGGGGDGRYGPPYIPEHNELDWGSAGSGAHDYLGDMAVDGSSFWLHRADGGSVYFTGAPVPGGPPVDYQAVTVFDPHGLWTTLEYNSAGYLWKVEQEGGRFLTISWGSLGALWASPVIMRVDTGGPAAGQTVTYQYQTNPTGYALARVNYPNDLGPGQSASALYFYGTKCVGGDQPGPCTPAPGAFPLLKYADDPHYAGAMTKIRDTYRGTSCPEHHTIPVNPHYFTASEFAIASEQSGETGVNVSSLVIDCNAGTRTEYNGFNARRMFYFGRSAGNDPGQHQYHCLGYQLAKVTDFSFGPPENAPFDQQNLHAGPSSRDLGWPGHHDRIILSRRQRFAE
jgi:hypothetical protein